MARQKKKCVSTKFLRDWRLLAAAIVVSITATLGFSGSISSAESLPFGVAKALGWVMVGSAPAPAVSASDASVRLRSLDMATGFWGIHRLPTPEFASPNRAFLTNGGSINAFGSALTENFDGLANTGTNTAWTDNITISGAYSDAATYNAGTGSSTTGSLYSFGVAGTNPVTDRALGGVASAGTGNIYYGFKLTNNTGGDIVSLNISYNGEQWRNSSDNPDAAETIVFQYQVASSGTITDVDVPATGWTTFSALSFSSPIFTNSSGALDGNDPANRTAKSATLTFPTPVANGQEIWIRWEDPDDAGSDHGLAIDDLSITPAGCFTDPIVTTSADSGAGSLRQAVIDACVGSTITFDMNTVTSPITLTSGQITKNESLTIQGPGADVLAINGNGGPIFGFNGANAIKVYTVNDLTLTGAVNTINLSGSGDDTLNVNRVTATGNADPDSAGSVMVASFAEVNITSSSIVNNFHAQGLDISQGSTTNIVNSTFSGNANAFGGSAISIFPGTGVRVVNLTSNTIADNGGAGVRVRNFSGGTLTVNYRNTIFSNNASGSFTNGTVGTLNLNSLGYNLLSDSTGDATPDATDHLNTSAMLAALADNGGTTPTRSLNFGSPAIDKGNAFGLTTDQRGTGFARTFDDPGIGNASGGDGTDIGAFEAQAVIPPPNYTLSYLAGPNGSITGTSPQTVPQGGSGTAVFAQPDAGYHFVNWSDASTANPRMDTNVMGNITVTANFAINVYTLTYTAGPNGSIIGTSPQMVNFGQNGTPVTAVPDPGYQFVNWSDSSPANPRQDFSVAGDITVTANFAAHPPTISSAPVLKTAGGGVSNSQIATVSDANQAANTLTVTVNGGASATVNGVTVSNIAIDGSGNVTADVDAAAGAADAAFTLTVTDSTALSADATLVVIVLPPCPDGSISQQAYKKASNTGSGDFFGWSVAVSGDTVVVGAPFESSSTTGVNSTPDEGAPSSGAAYVFTRTAGVWSQQAYLKASNTGAGDQFGYSVAVSGDTVVVGAYLEASSTTGVNSTPDEGAGNSGAAYVFTRTAGVWSQQAYLKASNTGAGDQFGYSVGVSGDTVVVGALLE
ncbi:MAG: choice-of-anchor Q domain-containing protein, partial [Pyrinomonadaceae bacterium]